MSFVPSNFSKSNWTASILNRIICQTNVYSDELPIGHTSLSKLTHITIWNHRMPREQKNTPNVTNERNETKTKTKRQNGIDCRNKNRWSREEKRERRDKTISNWKRLTQALRGLPTGHNISHADGNSTDGGESMNDRNPSSTGMGCYKNFEHAQNNRRHNSQVRANEIIVRDTQQ